MEATEWIWQNGKFVKWDDAKVHVLTHTLHYGDGAFEGIRCYDTKKGPGIFRLKEHIERLKYSAAAIQMEMPKSVDELCDITVDLVRKNNLKHCYIRPLVYCGYGVMGLNPKSAPTELMVACWPWGAYLPYEMVDVKISSFIRVHPKSTIPDAKLCAHYTNSMLAVLEIRGSKYHEALLCDIDGNIMEGPGENFFMVVNGELHTPAPGGILCGITRSTILEIAKANGIKCVERKISKTELSNASEAFYTGTAAEVTPIRSIDDAVIGDGVVGEVTALIKKEYHATVNAERSQYEKYITFVN